MSKYHATPTMVDGIRFASRAEANRYGELKMLARAGEITDLELQPRFPLVVNGVKVGTYVADFRYRDRGGATVTEDVKGVRTAVYRIKARLVTALYGFEIAEVEA